MEFSSDIHVRMYECFVSFHLVPQTKYKTPKHYEINSALYTMYCTDSCYSIVVVLPADVLVLSPNLLLSNAWPNFKLLINWVLLILCKVLATVYCIDRNSSHMPCVVHEITGHSSSSGSLCAYYFWGWGMAQTA